MNLLPYARANYGTWNENSYTFGFGNPTNISPEQAAYCKFTLTNNNAGPGDYSFSITIQGADSSTG